MKRLADEFERRFAACQETLLGPAAMLFAMQRVHAEAVREKTKQAYGRLVDAHMLVTGVLGAALLRVNAKITETDEAGHQQDALLAAFVIGLDPCEQAIVEGRYLQAHALLRQEMEAVAQLAAIQQGRRRDGRQPNVAVLERSLSRLYGDLSASAHLAQHRVVRDATTWDVSHLELPGPTAGTRYFPEFDEGLARRSFGLHLLLILRAIEQMSLHFAQRYVDHDLFTPLDLEAVDLAVSLMQMEGIVQPVLA